MNKIKNLFCCIALQQKKKKLNLAPSTHLLPLGPDEKKKVFEAEAEAWVGGAQCQTSATVDRHGSVSKGERVGGDEGQRKGETRGEGSEVQGKSKQSEILTCF